MLFFVGRVLDVMLASVPVAVDLVDVALGEVPEHGAHVEVVLDRGAVETHAQLFGQPLDLVAKRDQKGN